MHLDELLERAASEGERTVSRIVAIAPDAVMARAQTTGMRLTEFLASSRGGERRETKYRHMFGPPAPDEAIQKWTSETPTLRLPDDLEALVRRVNGIHLWANVETGRSYAGLAPIEEWQPARAKFFGPDSEAELLDDRFLALSYHEDDAAFVVLDRESGTFYLMDAAGPDTSTPIARNVDELLEWLWRTRIEPR